MQKIIQKKISFEKPISPLTQDDFLLLIRYFSEEGFVSRFIFLQTVVNPTFQPMPILRVC